VMPRNALQIQTNFFGPIPEHEGLVAGYETESGLAPGKHGTMGASPHTSIRITEH